MYQFSLSWYKSMLVSSIKKSKESKENFDEKIIEKMSCQVIRSICFKNRKEHESSIEHRNHLMITCFVSLLHRNTCKSLLEKDKFNFTFILTLKLLELSEPDTKDKIQEYIRFLITEGCWCNFVEENPCKPWMSDKSWVELRLLSEINYGEMKEVLNSILTNKKEWQKICNHHEPHNMCLPENGCKYKLSS